MPKYPDLEPIRYRPFPEGVIRSLWEPLGITSVLDCGAGTNGVFDYGYIESDERIVKREANDIFWIREMSPKWKTSIGVDVQDLSQYADRSFDLVMCMEVLEHVPDPTKALKELCRVANKIVIITSDDESVHSEDEGSTQQEVTKVNKNQAYIKQPDVQVLQDLGFEVRVEVIGRRQLVAWKIIDPPVSPVIEWNFPPDTDLKFVKNYFAYMKDGIGFDIGANEGDFIGIFSNPSIRFKELHAFEPAPGTFDKLQKRYGDQPNIILNNVGVSDKEEELTDQVFIRCWAMVKKDEFADTIAQWQMDENGGKPFSAHLTTIDKYCEENKIDHVDFIKLDVDGYDYKALLGMQKIINQSHPVMLVELSSLMNFHGNTESEFIKFFYDRDYKIATLTGKIYETPEEVLADFPYDSSMDVLAIPIGKML